MRECGDFLFAQGIGGIRHRRYAAAYSQVGLVVMECLDQVFLALAGEARNRFRSGECIAVA